MNGQDGEGAGLERQSEGGSHPNSVTFELVEPGQVTVSLSSPLRLCLRVCEMDAPGGAGAAARSVHVDAPPVPHLVCSPLLRPLVCSLLG